MRNKYKSLQNKGQPQNEKSHVISEKINSLSNNFRSNNINKNSFISNFDNKEKLDKMINQINDKEKSLLMKNVMLQVLYLTTKIVKQGVQTITFFIQYINGKIKTIQIRKKLKKQIIKTK